MDAIGVFNDTYRRCREDAVLSKSVMSSVTGQRYIPADAKTHVAERFEKPCEIVVSKKRTLEAASVYGGKVCIHNFASAYSPGGGVRNGRGAQEECLCRISTLYCCLNTDEMRRKFYGRHRNLEYVYYKDAIFTPSVKVFKEDTDDCRPMPKEKWFDVDVVTCSAPDLRKGKISDAEMKEVHRFLLDRVCGLAAENGNDVLILGAFGCGVFRNDPRLVASVSKEIAEKYGKCFRTVEFAVYCGRDDTNYRIFRDTLLS